MSDFLMTEIRALAKAFEGLKWGRHSEEPDARVTVLFCEHATGVQYLVRHEDGWAWQMNRNDLASTVGTWAWAVNQLHGSELLRLPVAEELLDGGWSITEHAPEELQPEPVDEEIVDEAKAQLDFGLAALDAAVIPHARTEQLLRAQTHFVASIAVSLFELTALHKAYENDSRIEVTDLDNEVREVLKDGADEGEEKPGKEYRPGGVVGGPDFPWAR